ncbi:bile acid:sodium symporter family protein [Pseudovibrio sp. Ad26]|uniref:bile acid:sodium symporter family protein n=1 Tax=Pseudovibrio sp. Ad26 TaxID=989410 RepID=UPI0007AE4EE3|nr:bile acid:sodium symporter family protein [Pseudovibrio sp. Ad26]KZL06592.1 Sodium Bile acid symporter family protein [Pseudovibrio sp. Ad26]
MSDIDLVVLNFSSGSLTLLNGILGVVMFSIALDLCPADFKRLTLSPKPVVIGLCSQFLVLPSLTFLLVLIVQPRPSIALGLILVAACPGGNISNFITHRAGGNAALSVSMTAFATVGAIVATPFNIAFWGSLYGPTRAILQETHIDRLSVAITVCFMLVLPLFLGIMLNRIKPQLAAKIRQPLRMASMGIFIGFIFFALFANWSFFLAYVGAVASLVIVHNGLALATGYTLASVAGVSAYDRRAITIETGIQNSGLGLVLIFGFFGGLGGMSVVAAAWGIWHAISGLVLASFMARKAVKLPAEATS